MCPAETNRPEREAIGEPRKRSPSNHPTIIVGEAMLDSGMQASSRSDVLGLMFLRP